MARFRGAEPEDGDLNSLQAVLEYVTLQHNGRDLKIALLGVNSDNLWYPDEFERDEDFNSSSNASVEYCGFSKNFLYASKAGYQPKQWRKPQAQDDLPVVPSPPVSTENHAKRVAKLLEEEEKSKEKAERKRLKKMRQKERRRLAKLEKEKKNPNKNVQAACKAGGSVNGERRTSRDLDSCDGSNSSDEDSSEEQESDGENMPGSSEELDLTSSFVSKAAVIAKRQLEQMPKSERRERSERRNSPAPPPAPASRPKDKPNAGYNEFKQASDSPSSEDVVKISTELAVTGNKFASAGHFAMAVKYFTDAIKYNPKEYRLFGNRSFCFEKMQEYERSLTDAELSLNMCPGWVKGLYRKGRALAGLQRYEEAAQAFKEVLQLDTSCVDAAQELMRVQITQLMEFGFSREQSSNALIIHGTVQKALEALSKISGVPVLKTGSYSTTNPTVPAQKASSNPTAPAGKASSNPTVPAGKASSNPTVPAGKAGASRPSPSASTLPPRFQGQGTQAAKPPPTQVQNAPKTQAPTKPTPRQPNSPVKTKPNKPQAQPELFPIWVGNMVQTVSEPVLHDLFSSIGEVHSVKLLRSKRCAFVNFTNQQHCDAAIHKFHGHELHEARITVRYPDRIPTHLGISKAALQAVDSLEDGKGNSMRECFFWRNLGCSRRPACPFRHVLEHKGIDRRRTPEQ